MNAIHTPRTPSEASELFDSFFPTISDEHADLIRELRLAESRLDAISEAAISTIAERLMLLKTDLRDNERTEDENYQAIDSLRNDAMVIASLYKRCDLNLKEFAYVEYVARKAAIYLEKAMQSIKDGTQKAEHLVKEAFGHAVSHLPADWEL
jgi:Mg2+ and Co2+ transporter CorA